MDRNSKSWCSDLVVKEQLSPLVIEKMRGRFTGILGVKFDFIWRMSICWASWTMYFFVLFSYLALR